MQRVLIVEDNAVERQVYSNWLSRNGLEVEAVNSGEEAMAHLRDNALPDVLLTDIVMASMSGFDVCRRVKMDPRTRKIPIVICSSKALKYDQAWGMRQGASAYLIKPVTTEQLLRTIEAAIKGERDG